MKSLMLSIAAGALCIAGAVYAAGDAKSFDQQSWDKKVQSYTQMQGRTFQYAVSGYRIRLHFIDESTISWERLEAPDDTAGLMGQQTIDRQDVHPGIFVMAWTEDDGAHVVDVVDIQRMNLYANFGMPDGQRFQVKTPLEEIN